MSSAKWWHALVTALGAAAGAYWETAPGIMKVAVYALGPLLIADTLTAEWQQRRLLRRQGLTSAQVALIASIDPQDTWRRGYTRFAMTLFLLVLAGAADALTGTRHLTVTWVLLWATSGHGAAVLRRLNIMAKLEGMELPVFPDGTWEKIRQQQEADDGKAA